MGDRVPDMLGDSSSGRTGPCSHNGTDTMGNYSTTRPGLENCLSNGKVRSLALNTFSRKKKRGRAEGRLHVTIFISESQYHKCSTPVELRETGPCRGGPAGPSSQHRHLLNQAPRLAADTPWGVAPLVIGYEAARPAVPLL